MSTRVTGLVFDIQRFSVHDGPGIRTTVFLKGCPLACRWCHNPEGMTAAPEILTTPARCIGCGACVSACPHSLPSAVAAGWAGSRSLCEGCGRCAEACPTGARRRVGREMTVEALIEEVVRDDVFHRRSGGGVTFSGGEPLKQASFVLSALRALKELGVHTALDTCGLARREDLIEAGRVADLVLFDVKHTDPAAHEAWTGAPNDRILANLSALGGTPARIWVRVPILPGVNDDADNLRRTAALAAALPGVEQVSLLPFHRFGVEKRDRVAVTSPAYEGLPPEADHIRHVASVFEAAGLHTVVGG